MTTINSDDFTDDGFLGGRLRLRQPTHGHRAGHDAVLLAAATEARSGELVVELGAGVGAAALALALRIPRIDLALVERDAALADFAAENVRFNGMNYARVLCLDVAAPAKAFAAAGLVPGCADVVMMNPPFNDPVRHRPSPDARRSGAHMAQSTTLESWIHAARRVLRPGGTLSMIWRADGLADVLAALRRGFGGVMVLPVFPKPGEAAIRVLVSARKGSRQPSAYYEGIVLNTAAGTPTQEFERIGRGDGGLTFGGEEAPQRGPLHDFLADYAAPDSPSETGFL